MEIAAHLPAFSSTAQQRSGDPVRCVARAFWHILFALGGSLLEFCRTGNRSGKLCCRVGVLGLALD